MKFIALALALLMARSAIAASPPCDAADADCLIRKSLELTYENEALRKERDIYQQRYEEEVENDHSARWFLLGAGVGVVFFGVATTIALKVIAATAAKNIKVPELPTAPGVP